MPRPLTRLKRNMSVRAKAVKETDFDGATVESPKAVNLAKRKYPSHSQVSLAPQSSVSIQPGRNYSITSHPSMASMTSSMAPSMVPSMAPSMTTSYGPSVAPSVAPQPNMHVSPVTIIGSQSKKSPSSKSTCPQEEEQRNLIGRLRENDWCNKHWCKVLVLVLAILIITGGIVLAIYFTTRPTTKTVTHYRNRTTKKPSNVTEPTTPGSSLESFAHF